MRAFACSMADTLGKNNIFIFSLFFIKDPMWSLAIIGVPFFSFPVHLLFEILSVHFLYFEVPTFSTERLRRTISDKVLANATGH